MSSPLTWGVMGFVLLIIVELVYSLKYDAELYQWKDFAASASMGAGAVVLAIFTKAGSLAAYFAVYFWFNPEVEGVRTNIFGWGAFGFAWYVWIICQFLDDFNYYWYHRLSHTIRVLWAAHIVHHSSDNYNLGTGIRNGWVTLFYKPMFYMWLPAIGFHPLMVATCLAIESLWQFQLHTKYVPRLGFFEKFMNSHRQHHVHHSSNIEYLDMNHGGYLNMFDKMFGTWKDLDESKEIQFGVLHPPNSHNPLVILTHEYKDIWNDVRKSKNLKEAFMYTFGPPGWTPDASFKTVRQMQQELEEQKKATAKEEPAAVTV